MSQTWGKAHRSADMSQLGLKPTGVLTCCRLGLKPTGVLTCCRKVATLPGLGIVLHNGGASVCTQARALSASKICCTTSSYRHRNLCSLLQAAGIEHDS